LPIKGNELLISGWLHRFG